ncbi:MAG: hypothetical protein NZ750_13700 [Anaerolineae bacterium]|nr:hypothetical protein [Anaerolineae bacterium]MDW8172854.1 hypothetical protein [Anaerolineae bacterium]
MQNFIRSVLFFGAWGSWWGFYLGALCGTLIVPLFGTILAAQTGLVMGVLAGLAWGAVLGLAIGPLHDVAPPRRTQVRRTWATIASLVGGIGSGLSALVILLIRFPEVSVRTPGAWMVSLGTSLWTALALADATTRYVDRLTGHPDPLRPFGGPLSSSYFFFMEGGAAWRMAAVLGLTIVVFLSRPLMLSWLDLLLYVMLAALPLYSVWALLNGTFIGLLNRVVFAEYFQDMPRRVYRRMVIGASLALTLGSLGNLVYVVGITSIGWLTATVMVIITAATAHSYANAYYANVKDEVAKNKHRPAAT